MKSQEPIQDPLDRAVLAVRQDEPEPAEAEAAAGRVWQKLHVEAEAAAAAPVIQITGCEDVRRLLPGFQRGQLAAARALLVEDHLRECSGCRNFARQRTAPAAWSAPVAASPEWNLRRLAFAAVVLIAVTAGGLWTHQQFFAAPEGYRAVVAGVDGQLFLMDAASGERTLAPGEEIAESEVVRTASGSHAVLRLRDGSLIEMNERSQLGIRMTRRDTRVQLDRGHIIVQAAKRSAGQLFVDSRDLRVAVTGTIFSVNSGLLGSRVAVVEGSVRVDRDGAESLLGPGDLSATSTHGSVSVADEISWSRNRERYIALLAELSVLQNRLESIQLPNLRYESRLLNLVPPQAVLFAAVPNYGQALTEALQILTEQMQHSKVLQEWWNRAHQTDGPTPQQLFELARGFSDYVGDEVVFAVTPAAPGSETAPLLIAEINRPGLREYIESEVEQLVPARERGQVHFYDAHSIAAARGSEGVHILVRDDLVAISPNPAWLRWLNQQAASGPTAFTQGAFGQRIRAAYGRGVGLIVAADLQTLRRHAQPRRQSRDQVQEELAGLADLRYFIAEHRDAAGAPALQAEMSFAGQRRGIASWLAAPAAVGSLDFISPNAWLAVAGVSKDPGFILDDMMLMGGARARQELDQFHSETGVNLREELLNSLGGDFAFALDGQVAPLPSWKFVAEVTDPATFQSALERLVAHSGRRSGGESRGPAIQIHAAQVQGQTFYTVTTRQHGQNWSYTYADGYLVAGSSRAMVMAALQTRRSGVTLASSSAFRELLPAGQHTHFSAVLYQNLGPVLNELAAQVGAAQSQTLSSLAGDGKPTVVVAYAGSDRIELASSTRLLGLDLKLLALAEMLDNGRGTARGSSAY